MELLNLKEKMCIKYSHKCTKYKNGSCKDCNKKYYRKNKDLLLIKRKNYYLKNKEKELKRSNNYHKLNPNNRRESKWKNRGILNSNLQPFLVKDYNNFYRQQDGCCAICKKSSNEFKYRLSVDHNHKTGIARGLLCFYCNKFMVAKHTYETASKLLDYLKVEQQHLDRIEAFKNK